MKKVLSLVLVLTLVLGSFSFAFAAAPSDVVGTEYEEAVDRLIQLGVLTGYEDGSFKPEEQITRAQFAAIVVRVKGLEAAAQAAKGTTAFSDVAAGSWASGYINIASKMGFVKGMGDGTFAPNSPVTYEQAVTMVMRALGYEEAANARGGYPYGYLIVANENGLLDSVRGTQGAPAPRGLVAQLVDNALEIPQMIQTGFGTQTKWVKSGTEGTEERTLLNDLGFYNIVGRVVEINSDKKFVKVEDSDGKVKPLYVDENFDFQNAYGLRVRVWYDTYEKVKLYTALDTPMFDAVEYDSGYLYLYGEDDYYDLATDTKGNVTATLLLNGKKVAAKDFNADYAKVVLDSYGDIIWAEGFTFDGNIVVEKLDGNVVESYGYEELSLKGYTVVDRDGKTISLDDLEQNDIVFYNSKVKFAVVYNEAIEGKIGKIYTDSFVFEGKTYENAYVAKYLDGEVLGDLDSTVVNSIKTQDEKVTIFVDFYGNLVLVVGKQAVSTSSNYFLVIDSVEYTNRGTTYYTLDVLNSKGEIVKYDLTASEVTTIVKNALSKPSSYTLVVSDWEALIGVSGVASGTRTSTNKVVKLSLNSSGKVTGIKELTPENIDNLATTAKYVNNKLQLQGSAVVFRDDNATKYEYFSVTTWDKAEDEFTKVVEGKAYGENGKVVAIYAKETNAKSATTNYTGLVEDIKVLRNKVTADVTIIVKGEEKVYTVEVGSTAYNALKVDEIQTVTVVDKTGEITAVSTPSVVKGAVIVSTTPGSRTIVVKGTPSNQTFYLESDAVIYRAADFAKLRFADLKKDDVVDIYRIAAGSSYVNYVVKGTQPSTGDDDNTDVYEVTADFNSGDSAILLNGKAYVLATGAKVVDKNGTALTAPYTIPAGVEVEVTFVEDSKQIFMVKVVDFTGTDLANYVQDIAYVAADKAALTVSYNGTDPTITLPTTGASGNTTIEWKSSSTAINTTTGAVTRPAATESDITVKLTATIKAGLVSDTKEITVVVKRVPSTVATLKSLKVGSHAVDLAVASTTGETLSLTSAEIAAISKIELVKNDSKAVTAVSINGTAVTDLTNVTVADGDEITVVVTAEDGTTTVTYTVTISEI